MAYYENYLPDETGELQKVVINAGVGFVLPYYGETAPPGTLACDGSEISRTVYDELFAVLGTKAGAGNGSTTFNLPDLRGQFVRGTGGSAAALGTAQGDAIREINGSVYFRTQVDEEGNRGQLMNSASGCLVYTSPEESVFDGLRNSAVGDGVQKLTFSAERVVPTASENRPTNVPCSGASSTSSFI